MSASGAGWALRVVRGAASVARWAPVMHRAVVEEAARSGGLLSVNPPAFYGGFHGSEGATLLALAGERLVGFCLLALGSRINPVYDGLIAELGVDRAVCCAAAGVWVEPSMRGRGVGRRLVAERVAVARALGAAHVFATVHPDNGASLELHRGVGARMYGPYRVYSGRVLRLIAHAPLAAARSGGGRAGEGSDEEFDEAVDRHDGGGAE